MARKKAKALPPKMISVYAEILQETDLAILVSCDIEADGVWLPKSQINYSGERGDTGVEIEIPEFLAEEKGFYDGMGSPIPSAPEAHADLDTLAHPLMDEDEENPPADKRSFGDNVKWIKEEEITASQPLSESEKAKYA